MKKFFKWFFLILGSLLLLIVIGLICIPIFFKDDIQASIKKVINEQINAEVYFDIDKFDVSIFSNFPNLTVTMGDFGVVGIDEFKGDTLAGIKRFELELDLNSVIGGDEYQINGVYLTAPNINLKTTKNGSANWDIAKESGEDAEEETEEGAELKLQVKEWKITEGKVVYDDVQGKIYAEIVDLNNDGGLKFSGSIIDLITNTNFKEITLEMDGQKYLDKYSFDSKLDAVINQEKMSFEFGENHFQLNDFKLFFKGAMAILADGMSFDLSYGIEETTFKDLLSLIPAVFLDEEYANIVAGGSLQFEGEVKGDMVGDKIPPMDLKLLVKDGAFQYPDLPSSINDVNVDLHFINKDGVIDNSIVDLKKMHAKLGANPIDVQLLIEGFTNVNLDGNIKASLNLGDLMKAFPIEDLDIKGQFNIDANAKGVYNEQTGEMPTVNAALGMKQGFVKSGEYPPLTDIHFNSNVSSNGEMSTTTVSVKDLAFLLQEDAFRLDVDLSNFDDLNYKVDADGRLDLKKLTDIYPLEDMELSGIIDISDFKTSGKMSDIDNENYTALLASGKAEIKDLVYKDEYMLDGLKIDNSVITFTPERINIESYKGYLSKSDIAINGYVSNYMGYLFSETDTVINGNMQLASNTFNVDEWMEEDGDVEQIEETSTEDEEALAIVPIPKSINFTMGADFKKVIYDNMNITNMKGQLVVRDGILYMNNLNMNILGAKLITSGTYNTKNLKKPGYTFDLDIRQMKIADAYNYFEVVQKYMPTGDKFDGTFSANLNTAGDLKQDYMPVYETLTANGVLDIHKAVAKTKDMKAIKSAAKLAKSNVGDLSIVNEKMNIEIVEGELLVRPFKAKIGNSEALIRLIKGLDGSINHELNLSVPASGLNSSMKGLGANVGDEVVVDIGIQGTEKKPKPKILGTSIAGGVKGAATKVIDEHRDKLEDEIEREKKRLEAEKKRREEELRKKAEEERRKREEELKRKAEEEAKKKAGNLIKGNLFK